MGSGMGIWPCLWPGNHGLGATVTQTGSAQKEVERQEGGGALTTETSVERHVTWLTKGRLGMTTQSSI